ncbi:unnamed protein product [Amoebophrya sp. A25]|nr:unnamed protein product [Amoebophrya sp. A25]|eukprot:GSA25T00008335001.1
MRKTLIYHTLRRPYFDADRTSCFPHAEGMTRPTRLAAVLLGFATSLITADTGTDPVSKEIVCSTVTVSATHGASSKCLVDNPSLSERADANLHEITLQAASFARVSRTIMARARRKSESCLLGDTGENRGTGSASKVLSLDEDEDAHEDAETISPPGEEITSSNRTADKSGASSFNILHVGPFHLRESVATGQLYATIERAFFATAPTGASCTHEQVVDHDLDQSTRGEQQVSSPFQFDLIEANPAVLRDLKSTLRVRFPHFVNRTNIVHAAVLGIIPSDPEKAREDEEEKGIHHKNNFVPFYSLDTKRIFTGAAAATRGQQQQQGSDDHKVDVESRFRLLRLLENMRLQAFTERDHLLRHMDVILDAMKMNDHDAGVGDTFDLKSKILDFVKETHVPAGRLQAFLREGEKGSENTKIRLSDILLLDTPNSVDILMDFLTGIMQTLETEPEAVVRPLLPCLIRFHWFWGHGYFPYSEVQNVLESKIQWILDTLVSSGYEVLQHREFFYAILRNDDAAVSS